MSDTTPRLIIAAVNDLPSQLDPYVARIRRIGAKVIRDAERLEKLERECLSEDELECIIEGLTDLKMRFIQSHGHRDWNRHDRVVERLTGIRERR